MIAASPYLLHICLFLTLNYITSSFFYFEKSIVVAAAASDAAGRTRLFAQMNAVSGAVIAVVQVSLSCLSVLNVLHAVAAYWRQPAATA